MSTYRGKQLPIQLSPVDQDSIGVCGGMTPQIRDPTPHHQQQSIRVDLKAVAHEASYFNRAAGLHNLATRRWRAGGELSRIATQQGG